MGSSSGTGATITHVYSAAGDYTATLIVRDGFGGDAFGSVSGTVKTLEGGSPVDNDADGILDADDSDDDNDNDGFSDEFEAALGTDPNLSSNSPTGGGSTPVNALSVTKLGISLNYSKSGADKITLSGTVPVPAGFTLSGTTVVVNVGGVIKSFALSVKGQAKSGGGAFKLGVKAKKGAVPAQTAKFSTTFANGTFANALADEQLTGDAVKNGARIVRVEILFNGALYRKDQPQIFTAGKGKGKTK